MNNDSIELILAIAAVVVAGAALTVGSVALAFVVGIKNSTHQVVWEQVKNPSSPVTDDPFSTPEPEEEELTENPNKKIKRNPEKEEEEFADLSDPTVTSNNWN